MSDSVKYTARKTPKGRADWIAYRCNLTKIQKDYVEFSIREAENSLIDYIENDAEISMPIDELFNKDGSNLTKKKYGKVLIKYLIKELKEYYH